MATAAAVVNVAANVMDKLKDDVVQIQQKVDELNAAIQVRISLCAHTRLMHILLRAADCARMRSPARPADGGGHELLASEEPRAAQLHQDGALLHAPQGTFALFDRLLLSPVRV